MNEFLTTYSVELKELCGKTIAEAIQNMSKAMGYPIHPFFKYSPEIAIAN